jgi:hypothetical protein
LGEIFTVWGYVGLCLVLAAVSFPQLRPLRARKAHAVCSVFRPFKTWHLSQVKISFVPAKSEGVSFDPNAFGSTCAQSSYTLDCANCWLFCSAPCRTQRPCQLVGLARNIYTRCINGIIGKEINRCTVIYGAYMQFWPTLVGPPTCQHPLAD